ncbi:MAG: phosphoenolpyruvate--protein phosphotransferase [Verrucomicrobia bacterium]|nr:phosphoenolpyruvate--protein phosphotransferase [Verrucomicrobiota bacterium]
MSDSQPIKTERAYRGIPVSPGVAKGLVYVYAPSEPVVEKRAITDEEMPGEFNRLEQALIKTREQLIEIPKRLGHELGNGKLSIFDAHLLVLEDPLVTEQVFKRLKNEKLNVEYILHEVMEQYMGALARVEDGYLRERVADVRDVTQRILRNLAGHQHDELLHLSGPRIVVAHDLAPSETALMDRSKVIGFATEVGSRTSHTAILARSQNLPAVVALHDLIGHLASGEDALLDGYSGLLIVNPTEQTLYEYGQLERRWHTIEERLLQVRGEAACTRDGRTIRMGANIELEEEVDRALEHGAEGIGLYRTEYLFLNRSGFPSEDEQFQAYRNVAQKMNPREAIIRTLDIGGDKILRAGQPQQEANPFLGWRGVRFCLDRPDIFRTQMRAILRAGAEGNVKLMYPMVSDLHEVRSANELLAMCRDELRREGKPFNEQMQVGAMIEVPGAALLADHLAKHVQFFSIGTNDLIQYTMAVDRVNERVAHLYLPAHPAVLELIKRVVAAAHAHNLWVGVCGEMASEPLLVPLLVGLGVDELSMSAVALPAVKFLVRALNLKDAQALAEQALAGASASDVLNQLETMLRTITPELFELVKPDRS